MLRLADDDVLIDVGCGSGRVVCCAARLPIRAALGVELVPEAARRAQSNLVTLRGRRATTCAVVQGDALDFDISDATVIFLFNPFGEGTMSHFLRKVSEAQVARRNLEHGESVNFRLVYHNPTLGALVQESSWVKSRQELDIFKHRIDIFTA
jgi:predicted RNA methylase